MPGRVQMIEEIKARYGLDSPEVFLAMLQVPREEFVPPSLRQRAYEDNALSIGFGQTISQPYTVAFMTNLVSSILEPSERKKVLEVGTGSGYQAAILAKLFERVFTLEIVPELAKAASRRLKKLGFTNVKVKLGSGEFGWKEESPFNAILVTAGAEKIPSRLLEQLADGGVLVAPVGKGADKIMTRFIKKRGKVKREEFGTFYFVPFRKSN